MILYNTTYNLDDSIKEQWLSWVKEKYIPNMISTGKFSAAKILKVLIEEPMGGVTYSIQFLTDSQNTLERFYKEESTALNEQAKNLFKDKMLIFSTVLEIIHEY